MPKWLALIWGLVLVLSTSAFAQNDGDRIHGLSDGPSFDCADTTSPIGRIICFADKRGPSADWNLRSASQARKFSLAETYRDDFEKTEDDWLQSLIGSCQLSNQQSQFSATQQNCVIDAYENRSAVYR